VMRQTIISIRASGRSGALRSLGRAAIVVSTTIRRTGNALSAKRLTMTDRAPLPVETRKPLTRREFGLLIIQQDGKCGCGCGKKLDFTKPRRVVDEHLVPLFSGGSNDLSNRALWDADCSKAKTSGEAGGRAKVRRFEQNKTQPEKRKRNGSKLQSRGFSKAPAGYVSPLSKKHPRYQKGKLNG